MKWWWFVCLFTWKSIIITTLLWYRSFLFVICEEQESTRGYSCGRYRFSLKTIHISQHYHYFHCYFHYLFDVFVLAVSKVFYTLLLLITRVVQIVVFVLSTMSVFNFISTHRSTVLLTFLEKYSAHEEIIFHIRRSQKMVKNHSL